VQAILPIATHFSIAWSIVCLSVCLSVVCHIRAPCLNRSTDLHAILQVHLGVQWHTVRWSFWHPSGGGCLGVEHLGTSDMFNQRKLALAYLWFTRGQHRSASSPPLSNNLRSLIM